MFVILYSLYLLDVSTHDFFGRIKIRANPLFFTLNANTVRLLWVNDLIIHQNLTNFH